MESECRVWKLISLRSWDRLAELAVFTGFSRGVVCFTSYRQSAQSEISEARNSKYVNTVIILNLNIYYRQENCALLRYYAPSSVNLLPTFRDKLTVLSSSVYWPLMVITYGCFGTTYAILRSIPNQLGWVIALAISIAILFIIPIIKSKFRGTHFTHSAKFYSEQ
jgi:hypothetical protein